jgi:hypothetical protein
LRDAIALFRTLGRMGVRRAGRMAVCCPIGMGNVPRLPCASLSVWVDSRGTLLSLCPVCTRAGILQRRRREKNPITALYGGEGNAKRRWNRSLRTGTRHRKRNGPRQRPRQNGRFRDGPGGKLRLPAVRRNCFASGGRPLLSGQMPVLRRGHDPAGVIFPRFGWLSGARGSLLITTTFV